MATISSLPRVTSLSDPTLFLVTENGVSKVVTWEFIKNNARGYSGSASNISGPIGARGYNGSQGPGFVGSRGTAGPAGGYTGSSGLGFVGSKGPGYTGSKGEKGDPQGYTGSGGSGFAGSIGYNGSRGFSGSIGFIGSMGYTGSSGAFAAIGYVGSPGATGSPGGFVGSQGAIGPSGGYTGSRGLGYTGSAIAGYVGSPGSLRGFTGSGGGGGGGVGLTSRLTITGTTNSLANGASGNVTLSGYKSYALLKVQTNGAAWVRIYSNAASQTADASRTIGNDPVPGAGVIAEVINTGNTTQPITPATIGFNDDSPVSGNVYVTVTNQTGGTTAITVTLTVLQLEA